MEEVFAYALETLGYRKKNYEKNKRGCLDFEQWTYLRYTYTHNMVNQIAFHEFLYFKYM